MRRQHSDALFSVRLSLLYHVFLSSSRLEEDSFEEPLSHRRQKNKRAEEELHHISEKLSHRLEELDQVCICVYCVRSQHIILNVLYPSKSNFNPSCMCVCLCSCSECVQDIFVSLCCPFYSCNNILCVIPVDAKTSSE